MFRTIFQYEIRYWLRQPTPYVYAIFLFLAGFLTVSGMAAEASERFDGRIINAPGLLYGMTRRFLIVLSLLLPTIVGHSVFRDFNSKMHQLLYVYPLRKTTYLSAKFLSSFTVLLIIVSMLGLGYIMGSLMPWVNPDLVQPFRPSTYLQQYALFVIPNLFLLSAAVFGAVALTRSIVAGFTVILLAFLLPLLAGFFLAERANHFWQCLLDPMGATALNYYMENWTLAQRNSRLLPLQTYVLLNRLFWIFCGGAMLVWTFLRFQFSQMLLQKIPKRESSSSGPETIAWRIQEVALPSIHPQFSTSHRLKQIWRLSVFEFRHILQSWTFRLLVLCGLIFVLLMMASINPRWETETLPRTWQMLELPGQFYSGVINLITFLYAGFLVHRGRMTAMGSLVDVNPVSNGGLVLSKLLTLVKIQALLLFMVMAGGIAVQTWKGYYEYELEQYLFNLFGMNLPHFIIWAMLALFIHTVVNHPYLGFFLLLLIPVAAIGLAEIGPQLLNLHFLEQMMFRYNQAPGGVFGLRYSEMDGYGPELPKYFLYKLYWALAGALLLMAAILYWPRGLPLSLSQRSRLAWSRFQFPITWAATTVFLAFLGLAALFFYTFNIAQSFHSQPQRRALLLKAIERYEPYVNFPQPKITDVEIRLDLFPKSRQFQANGEYHMVNDHNHAIDTILVNYLTGTNCQYEFDRNATVISRDTITSFGHFDILVLRESLYPGDTMRMTFRNKNDRITRLRTNNLVKRNGTLLKDDVFPRLGNWLYFLREANGLGSGPGSPHPADSNATFHAYTSMDADRVRFEAIVSTSKDQTALAPGQLIRDWQSDGRRYFHYRTERPIALNYLFTSAKYAVVKDRWNDVAIEIYHHPDHTYNLDRWMAGLKASLSYCTENFSPYQFGNLRVAEFSQTGGASAHGFPGLIPAGEGTGFIAAIEDGPDGGVDYAFGTAVHEVAHQWWGQQVMPAAALGAKFVSESMAEYTNLMVAKKVKGFSKMRQYLELNHQTYRVQRLHQRRPESPLLLASNDQKYIVYPKGAIALYSISEHIGEQQLNAAIQRFVKQVTAQESRYATSFELVDYIRRATPDSLQYLITDLFETVTLYDNRIEQWQSSPLPDGRFRIDIEFSVRKYRSGPLGQHIYSDNQRDSISHQLEEDSEILHSLPLSDYIDLAVYGADDQECYFQSHRIERIANTISIVVKEKPIKVVLDPNLKLIDRDLKDNEQGLRSL